MMTLRKAFLFLIISITFLPFQYALGNDESDPALLRRHLIETLGDAQWTTSHGYRLTGIFDLRMDGEEIHYKAEFVRSSERWAADFAADNSTRNQRYVVNGKSSWIASPEITVDTAPEFLPYIAQFDFPLLYGELLRILEKGNGDPAFALLDASGQVYVRGKIGNGWEATYVINKAEYFPRKVLIRTIGKPSSAWVIPITRPDGRSFLIQKPVSTSGFEIWFSDPIPIEGGGYCAKRMDFADHGNIVGTFILDESARSGELRNLFERPTKQPWLNASGLEFIARQKTKSISLQESELSSFRSRIGQAPWSGWNKTSGIIAAVAIPIVHLGALFPESISFRLISLSSLIGLLSLALLLNRRKRLSGKRFSWTMFSAGICVLFLALIAGAAARPFHDPKNRSLIALHCAIKYAATGEAGFARRTELLLRSHSNQAPAQTMEELENAAQAYSFAYDLIRDQLSDSKQNEIEKELFEFVKPLFGAAQGWRANTNEASAIAAGLGAAGLVIGCEPYIKEAQRIIEQGMNDQYIEGVHRSGPGPGISSMNSAANLFFALKNAGRENYYAQPLFSNYLHASISMLSPIGTIPLFGETSLEDSADLSYFFYKAANQVSEQDGGKCIAAANLYWSHGCYGIEERIKKWIAPTFLSFLTYYKNPYVFLQFHQIQAPAPLVDSSCVLGNGRMLVMRGGRTDDSICLFLNAPQSRLDNSHGDILSFDLYANRSLLVHGPGYSGLSDERKNDTRQTSAANSITFNNDSQSADQCSGIQAALLNQPLFDFARALADKTYDYGQAQRDIVLVRPEKNSPAYGIVVDDITANDPSVSVQWYLHERGKSTSKQALQWSSIPFTPPKLRTQSVGLNLSIPFETSTATAPIALLPNIGVLYSQTPYFNQTSAEIKIEWMGSHRLCAFLMPTREGEAPRTIKAQGKNSCRIGTTDWFSMGDLATQLTIGPLTHTSEFVLVRDRNQQFPALLIASGTECRFNGHALISSKPITASLSGLNGGFLTTLPDTRLEIQSPEIKAGERFWIDNESIVAQTPGVVSFVISNPGEHAFHHD